MWAQPEIGEGNLWKIYIRASDPDGDLDKIWLGFDQMQAWHPPKVVIVPASQRKKLNGYVWVWAYLNAKVAELDNVYGEVEVIVEDRAGNMSKAITITFAVIYEDKRDTGPPPTGFDGRTRLGLVDLPFDVDPNNDDGDDGLN